MSYSGDFLISNSLSSAPHEVYVGCGLTNEMVLTKVVGLPKEGIRMV
jgi:hypothetical protein